MALSDAAMPVTITPEAAVANGADDLDIDRPVTQAPDPVFSLAVINAALASQRGALA